MIARLTLATAATLCLVGCGADDPRKAEIDAVTPETFSGVIVAAGPDGIVHSGTYGADPGFGPRSEWRWASVTKMLVSLIVLQEVEAGKLSLDAPISDVLDDLPEPMQPVTLRQLLSHTSGLANPDQTPDVPGTDVPEWATLDVADTDYCYGPMRAAPGEQFDYNACDFIVLEDVLRAVTGQDLPSLIKTRISGPLGLKSVRMVTEPGDDAQVVGTVDGNPVDSPLQLSALRGDAAVVGSPVDLVAVQRAFMAGEIVKDPDLRAEFGRGVPDLGYVALGVWGFEAQLPGCDGPVQLIERQGHLKGTKILTLMAPELRRGVVAFSNRDETDWGWIWQGSGLTYDLARTVFCES